jgi:hypothetical protein
MEGNSPFGVTGGGDGGYGSLGSGFSDSDGPDARPLGNWGRDISSTDREVIVFGSGGDFEWQHYQNNSLVFSESGAFSVSGSRITISHGGEPSSGTFNLSGDTLTLILDGETLIWTKM